MRIVFVRHGDPDYRNDCLTPLGRAQAKAAAERLKEEGISEIWSSTCGRALETADYAAKALGLPVKELDFMREITWGSRDGSEIFAWGHPWAIANELAKTGVSLTDPLWREHPFYRNNLVTDAVDKVEKGVDRWLASFGYLREGAYYRNSRENEEELTIALFSHGGSSAAAMGRILDLEFPYLCALMHIPFTGITVIRMDRRPGSLALPVLELSGDGKHILGVEAE